jgi:hypothetical protein
VRVLSLKFRPVRTLVNRMGRPVGEVLSRVGNSAWMVRHVRRLAIRTSLRPGQWHFGFTYVALSGGAKVGSEPQ